MALYTRQLNSLDELKKEQQRLKQELKDREEKGFFSMKDVLPGGSEKDAKDDKEDDGTDNLLSKAAGILGNSNASMLLNLAGPLLSIATGKAQSKILKTVAKELFGGYIKWKAVELGYRAVRMAVNKAKKKAEEAVKE